MMLHLRLRFMALATLFICLLGIIPLGAQIERGATEAQVLEAYGPPSSQMEMGATKVLIYGEAKITLKDGGVTKIRGNLPAGKSVATTAPSKSAAPKAAPTADEKDLAQKLRARQTKLLEKLKAGGRPPNPPANVRLIKYPSDVGDLWAYITQPKDLGKKHPAIIWLTGGFSNSISELAWTPRPSDNDQSATVFARNDIVTMYPSLRGGNDNPGHIENIHGEVLDVLAALDYLKKQPYVDPDRIYIGGHSTGGTLALQAAAASDGFAGAFAVGPVENVSYYGQDNLVYPANDRAETYWRSPINHLRKITIPVSIIEGRRGNYESLLALREASQRQDNIACIIVPNHDHFSVLYPISLAICNDILNGDGHVEKKDLQGEFRIKP